MTPDKSGCTCYDETTRKCPAHRGTPPPTDRARELVRAWVEDDSAGNWAWNTGTFEQLENRIAQLLRDMEAEVRERCAKVVREWDGAWDLDALAIAICEAKP